MTPLRFTWLGHAAVRVDLPRGEVVLIDPWLDANPKAAVRTSAIDRVDLILVTHGHDDHMGDVEALAKRHDCPVVCSYDLGKWFSARGVRKVQGMNLGGTQRLLGMKITQVRADHSSGFESGGRSVYGGTASGFIVRPDDGFCFYHAGDTALFSDMKLFGELYQPRLAFLPIGDLFTMDPEQAAHAAKLLSCQWVVPIHWGTFPALTGTPEELRQHLHALGSPIQVVELAPGASFEP
jgi:L-ascorbate metabolism protein UlaG (beta-lactamase superfamily)